MNKEQSDPEQMMHSTRTQTSCDANARMPDEGIQMNGESRGRESQLHDEKHTQRKNSRTSSREDRGEMQDIMNKYKVGN